MLKTNEASVLFFLLVFKPSAIINNTSRALSWLTSDGFSPLLGTFGTCYSGGLVAM